MNALSLFSGIGGLDKAAEDAGIRTVAMCEKNAFCRAVLKKHWPGVPIFEDIKTLRGEDIGAPIDVIHGGPPCQPVSLAGRRRGQSDERYLWGEVFRLVADIVPRFCVFENVPGILSIAADEICQELERIGYSVGICSFEAAAVGAPHRRMRVFFVAHSRRGLRERGAIERAICGEREGRPFTYAERSGGASVPDTPCDGCRSRRTESEGFKRETGTSDGSEVIPDTDSTRGLQQNGSVREFREWTCDDGGRFAEPGLGRVVDGFSSALDGSGMATWDREPDIPRVARGVKDRVNRLRALGNAVVPAQAYPIFRAIVETERSLYLDEN